MRRAGQALADCRHCSSSGRTAAWLLPSLGCSKVGPEHAKFPRHSIFHNRGARRHRHTFVSRGWVDAEVSLEKMTQNCLLWKSGRYENTLADGSAPAVMNKACRASIMHGALQLPTSGTTQRQGAAGLALGVRRRA